MQQELLRHVALPLAEFRPVITSLSGVGAIGNASSEHHLSITPALLPLLRQVNFTADMIFGDCVTATDPMAVLQTALDFTSKHGEGVLLSKCVPHGPMMPHVWADITLPDGCHAIYFAKARQSKCFHATVADEVAMVAVCKDLKRCRLQYRTGAETRSYLQTTDTVTKWDACTGHLAVGPLSGNCNLTLSHGLLHVHLTPFDRLSNKFTLSDLSALLLFNGKTLKQIVASRTLRQLMTDLLKMVAIRKHPEVVSAYQTALRDALAQLRALRAGIPKTELPAGLNAELRPYQKDGFDFLCHLTRLGRGGILADDMGLGKTLQTLSWLLWLKTRSQKSEVRTQTSDLRPLPSLVICPASVMHNWRREAEKFTPSAKPGSGLKVLVLETGAQRATQLAKLASGKSSFDLIITNYALLRRDLAKLSKISFNAIVIDEAQFIKNPNAQITKAIKVLRSSHGGRAQALALTGTPLENRLLDLWSIVDFVQPGYLGTQAQFNDGMTAKELKKQLRPIMLRRLKKDVAKDLPDRIELRRDCHLGSAQMAFYQQELSRTRDEVFRAVNEKGIRQSKLHVLAALTRLRQICCHPGLVSGGGGIDAISGKTEAVFELLDELVAAGKKVLVFSQFTRMLELLRVECKKRGLKTHLLTGDTVDRQAVVNSFQNSGPGVFLLSLRAAGTGLNLTTASEVILYDPWWNPAVEAQAIDRSHRIGQTSTVNAYRLITRGTIEERIWTIQQDKARTIGAVLGEGGFTRSLTKTDLEYLFGDLPQGMSIPSTTIEPAKMDTNHETEMLPRHPANNKGHRNTRAAHPVIQPSSHPTIQPPLWRQRLHQRATGVPAWRANLGN